MRHGRRARAAAAALALLATPTAWHGCGFGEGESGEGEAYLTVTRDYGAEPVLDVAVEDPPASENVLRALDREAEIETRYGGGFVQSIDGIAGGTDRGRRHDWFFYVNGVESPVGAAEVDVRPEERIWWDHHDWTDVMRVPAVVGSWPAPFSAADAAELVCVGAEAEACDAVESRVEGVSGAEVSEPDRPAPDPGGVRVIVGPWESVRRVAGGAGLERSPSRSGVFARFEKGEGGWELVLYDERLAAQARIAAAGGIVAALEGRDSESPVWVIAGTDEEGVATAVDLLDEESLSDRFAVAAAAGGEARPVPAGGGGG